MNCKSLLAKSLSLILLLSLGLSTKALAQSRRECPEIQIEIQTFNTTNKLNNGRITLKYSDTAKYKIFLLSGNGKNYIDASKTDLENLKKGDYNLIVQDPNGCSKHFKIKIE